MRIWDIHPGYLNDQSLLGEHRELHGIVSILVNGKKGYSRHPETLRWSECRWALNKRHQQLAAEMGLRGFSDKSPVLTRQNKGVWPETYIDEPYLQFMLLKQKYLDKKPGRIPLPDTAQQLWSQHKYSILARNVELYKKIGREVANFSPADNFDALTRLLSEQLRTSPTEGGIRNALQHMWGHIAASVDTDKSVLESWPLKKLLKEIQAAAKATDEPYLMASTALSELKVWIPAN